MSQHWLGIHAAVLASFSILRLSAQTLPDPLQDACRARGDRIYECVHRGHPYTLVLPERLPAHPTLIVWLHGAGRNHRTLIEQPATRAVLAATRHIVLMPEGGASWWIAAGQPERVMELTQFAARAFDIPPARRGCGGWSMGGGIL